MLAVLRAQFTHKGFSDGKAGVARLAACSPIVQVTPDVTGQAAQAARAFVHILCMQPLLTSGC